MPVTIPSIPFQSFQKIARANKFSLGCVISEKIDGSNGQIVIENGQIVGVGSRNRWIAPGKANDNFGFAGWIERNEEEILKLGDGTHFGEWYGAGIQRGYGLTGSDKRFALFNASRWSNGESRPACCGVVPVLYAGDFDADILDDIMDKLATTGSQAVPGYMKPEGVIVYIPSIKTLLKATYDNPDGKWRDLQVAA